MPVLFPLVVWVWWYAVIAARGSTVPLVSLHVSAVMPVSSIQNEKNKKSLFLSLVFKSKHNMCTHKPLMHNIFHMSNIKYREVFFLLWCYYLQQL
jgi:hypothetical protein